MQTPMAKSDSDNKTVQDYVKDLEDKRARNPEQLTSTNNVLIIVLTLISVQTCYCMFKLCWTTSHIIKPLIPTSMLTPMAKNDSDNKTVQDYLKDLEDKSARNPEQLTSTNNLLIIVLTLISVQTCYCMFKLCLMPSHNIKPLIPTYKPREWTNRSQKRKQRGTTQELTLIRHEKEIETNINNKHISNKVPMTNPQFHAMKF
jgi:hypothetical protein